MYWVQHTYCPRKIVWKYNIHSGFKNFSKKKKNVRHITSNFVSTG